MLTHIQEKHCHNFRGRLLERPVSNGTVLWECSPPRWLKRPMGLLASWTPCVRDDAVSRRATAGRTPTPITNLQPRSQNMASRTTRPNQDTWCRDVSDALITHEEDYAVSTGLFFVALVSCCRLLGPWEWWPVLCFPYHEKAFCFSSTKHSLMLRAEKTYDRRIFLHLIISRAAAPVQTHPVTSCLKNWWIRCFVTLTHLLFWTKTAAGLTVTWVRFTNADTKSAKPELSPCVVLY